MLNWALGFFLIALLAMLLGFGGVAGAAAGIGKFLVLAAVVLAIVYAIVTVIRRAT